ncbi:MAG TPA: hypothetical protein VF199_07980 [Bacillales bacterium]
MMGNRIREDLAKNGGGRHHMNINGDLIIILVLFILLVIVLSICL